MELRKLGHSECNGYTHGFWRMGNRWLDVGRFAGEEKLSKQLRVPSLPALLL